MKFSLPSAKAIQNITLNDINEVIIKKSKGWEVISERRGVTRLKKVLPKWELFEEEVIVFFLHGLGITDTSKRKVGRFEVDCVSIDDDFVFVIEAKTQEEPGPKGIQGYISEFVAKKTSIESGLKQERVFQEPLYILITKDIIPTKNDYKLAHENQIVLWNEGYFLQLQKLYASIGSRVKQYVYKDMGNKVCIKSEDTWKTYKIPALRFKYKTTDNGESYYLYNFYIAARDLLDLAYVYRVGTAEEGAYQRLMDRSKLEKVGEFIQDGNTFKSNLVISFDNDISFEGLGENQDRFDLQSGFLIIPKVYASAWVIDGQHRLYGYLHAAQGNPKVLDDKVPVLAMVKEDKDEQMKTFVSINQNQKPVDTNILWDLLSKLEPHDKGAISAIAKKLNHSGFFKYQIHIPSDPHTSVKSGKKLYIANVCKGVVDRQIFSVNNRTAFITKKYMGDAEIEEGYAILDHYFSMVSSIADQVNEKWTTHFLQTNNGFNIFLYLLKSYSRYADGKYNKMIIREFLEPGLLGYFKANEDRIDEIRGSASSEGNRSKYALELVRAINNIHSDFGLEFIKQSSNELNKELAMQGINAETISHRIDMIERRLQVLVRISLSGKAANWWSSMVPDKTKDRVRQMQEEDRKSLFGSTVLDQERYLYIKDASDIIGMNWDLFKNSLGNNKAQVQGLLATMHHIRNKIKHGVELDELSLAEKEKFEADYRILNRALPKYSK